MSEENSTSERGKFFVLFLLLVTTVFSAVLAGLQSDAGIRADQANVRSQYFAVLASAELVRQGQQSAYDFDTFSAQLQSAQEALILSFVAEQASTSGRMEDAATLLAQAAEKNARAEAARQLSVFYQSGRYAPKSDGEMPDMQAYMVDSFVSANDFVAQQNTAADDYHRWDEKSDGYLTILTVLALVFFLLGVAQNTRNLRWFFTISALVILVACGVWSLVILIS